MSEKFGKQITFKPGSIFQLLEQALNINEYGFSEKSSIKNLEEKIGKKLTGNGCVVRKNSTFYKKYNFCLFKEETGNAVTAIQTKGYREAPVGTQSISEGIKKKLTGVKIDAKEIARSIIITIR